MDVTVNPYQDVIDWLRSPAGEQWSEHRMLRATWAADFYEGMSWHLNRMSGVNIWDVPLYLGGVLSVKEDYYPLPGNQEEREEANVTRA